ncbi:uncharacterized protein LOC131434613 [Malaya genurostris]|uniref:uncharacterized protein LOC131434613 n=1 Tax=Malaya genurostris TaxID=325434 RepID=UPI0026F37E60|nr:uncharacterized protein LOC131434613 [Malaya genurostris]
MENLNFPPVEFNRPDCSDSSKTVFQEFAIVLHNFHLFESIPTGKWLSLLQEKALVRRKTNTREADRLHHLSEQLAENDELDKAMIHITQALYRCPPDSILAKAILCQKGELLRRKERIQDAIRHLEHCLQIEGERFSFGTYLCLLRCYKAMGNAMKVRTTLGRCATFFNRWKDEFQRYDSQLKNEPDVHMEEMKKEFDLHANCIPIEIMNDKSFRNEPAVQDDYEEDIELEPFMGFSTDSKLCGASRACSLNLNEKFPKLVANSFIPEGSIVLIERPLASHLEFSKVQCYTCHVVHPHLIPCFNCQGVFYCSYECQRKDAGYHKFECRGYQLLFFPLVNGNLELRMLIRTLNTLKRVLAVKPVSVLKNPRTAEELYKLLLEGREPFADLFNALIVKLDYSRFRAEDFDALMIKTEKLLSYIKLDGQLKRLYFAQWKHFDDFQFDIFVSGLLLHFCTLTMNKVSRLSFDIPATDDFVGRVQENVGIGNNYEQEPLKKTVLETLERYGKEYSKRNSIDTALLREGVWSHLEMLRTEYEDSRKLEESDANSCHQVWTRVNVKRLWQRCLDGAQLDADRRQQRQKPSDEDIVSKALLRFFDAYFDHFGEIPMCSRTRTFPNVMRAFYSTGMKLKHSCGPNLFFAMISNGLFVVRARRDIKKGEELTLNHGPHYKEASRDKRRSYLRKIYINCDCTQCGVLDDHWIQYQRIKCEYCLFKPAPSNPCPECKHVKELSWEMEILIQQLQDLELNLSKNSLPQLLPLTALGRTAGGLQTATASGKRKVELLLFFERIWQMVYVDASNIPLYNNLKEQLSCFAEEVIRDAVDEVYVLLKRCKDVIDTLFPHMSVQVANEYELVVRRAVKYMVPAKFLGVDRSQVYRTFDLAYSMIKHAFLILESHFLYDDESYRKLTVVEHSLRLFEENLRVNGAKEDAELFLSLTKPVKRKKDPSSVKKRELKQSNGKSSKETKPSDDIQDTISELKQASAETKSALLRNGKLPNGISTKNIPNGANSCNTSSSSSCSSSNGSGDIVKTMLVLDADTEIVDGVTTEMQTESKQKTGKISKRKETGAIPKPSRTTKHHRKV